MLNSLFDVLQHKNVLKNFKKEKKKIVCLKSDPHEWDSTTDFKVRHSEAMKLMAL